MLDDRVGWSVYFATSNGKTKIGVAGRPAIERVADIQRWCPNPVTLVASYAAGTRADALRIEARIHRSLEDRHSHGEWFHGEVSVEESSALFSRTSGSTRAPEGASRPAPTTAHKGSRTFTPTWTPQQWARHDERVFALRDAHAKGDQEAIRIRTEMESARTPEMMERVAAEAEAWYVEHLRLREGGDP